MKYETALYCPLCKLRFFSLPDCYGSWIQINFNLCRNLMHDDTSMQNTADVQDESYLVLFLRW